MYLLAWLGVFYLMTQVAGQSDKYTDENRPYKFGFNIEGHQHRKEEKDEKGIIKGEYGFITADGYYRVTVYATDESGDFKIISMKNYYVGFPPGDPTTTPGPTPYNRPAAARIQPLATTTQKATTTAAITTTERATTPNQRPTKVTRQQACSNCFLPPTTTKKPLAPSRLTGPITAIKTPSSSLTPQRKNNIKPVLGSPLTQNIYQPNLTPTGRLPSSNPNNDQPIRGGLNTDYKISPPSIQTGARSPLGPSQLQPQQPKELPDKRFQYQSNIPQPPPTSRVNLISNNEIKDNRDATKVQNNQPSPIIGAEKEGLPPGVTQNDVMDLLYRFNYTVGFHGHHEDGYRNGDKKGDYFVNGRDGISRKVEYIANEFGYQPNITLVNLAENDVKIPKEETEKSYGLEGYEFKWFYRK